MSKGEFDKKLDDVSEDASKKDSESENDKSVDFSAPENINARLCQMIFSGRVISKRRPGSGTDSGWIFTSNYNIFMNESFSECISRPPLDGQVDS